MHLSWEKNGKIEKTEKYGSKANQVLMKRAWTSTQSL